MKLSKISTVWSLAYNDHWDWGKSLKIFSLFSYRHWFPPPKSLLLKTSNIQKSWRPGRYQILTFCRMFALSTYLSIFCRIIWKWVSILWQFILKYFNFSIYLWRTISTLRKFIILIPNVFIPQISFCSLFFKTTKLGSHQALLIAFVYLPFITCFYNHYPHFKKSYLQSIILKVIVANLFGLPFLTQYSAGLVIFPIVRWVPQFLPASILIHY